MALKTNSKQAKTNLFEYIRENIADRAEEANATIESNKDAALFVYQTFLDEKMCDYYKAKIRAFKMSEYDVFKDWAQGLPLNGLFDFWYHCTAKTTASEILEETESEANRFTEEEAENFLTRWIYSTIKKEIERR